MRKRPQTESFFLTDFLFFFFFFLGGNLDKEIIEKGATSRLIQSSNKMSSASSAIIGLQQHQSSASDHLHGIINKTRQRKKAMNVVKTLVKNERIAMAASSPQSSRSPTPPVHHQQQQQQQQPTLHHGLDMSRNYSDFMRSLAAKYNNANPNEDTQQHHHHNHRYALMDSTRFSPFTFTAGNNNNNNNKAIGIAGSASSSSALHHHNIHQQQHHNPLGIIPIKNLTYPKATGGVGRGDDNHSPSPFHLNPLSELMAAHYPAAFPLMDMSSTQALLNIVRSASAQNAQQLQSYLRPTSAPVTATTGAAAAAAASTKRPLAVAVDHCPLDLSASVTSKRPAPAVVAYNYLEELNSSSREKASPKTRTMTPIKMVTSSAAAVAAAVQQQQQQQLPIGCRLACAADACTPAAIQVRNWTVDDVVDFVTGIDLCSDYAQVISKEITFNSFNQNV